MAVDVVVGDHDRPSMRDVTAYARSGQRHGWYENIKSVKWESPSPLVLGSRSSPSSMACPPCTHRRTSTARSSGRSSRRSNGSCAHTSPTRPSNRWPLERRRSQPRGRDAVRAGSRGRQYDPPLLRRSSDPRVDRLNLTEVAWAGVARLRRQQREMPLDEELRALVQLAEAAVADIPRPAEPPTPSSRSVRTSASATRSSARCRWLRALTPPAS
jgi:hypothetical protein